MFKLAVVIPAAGSGSRMGSRLPKPFLSVGSQPILKLTIEAFLSVTEVVQILIPCSKEWRYRVQDIIDSLDAPNTLFTLVEGGKERQYSISNALAKVHTDVDLIAVHDAVRPFIKPVLIRKCAEEAMKTGAAMIAVRAKDTIKQVNEHMVVTNTPDRAQLWQAQTPQVFQKNLLIEAYNSALKDGFVGTDDASLVERLYKEVKIVEGDRENLKITYPVDMKIAELMVQKESVL